PAGRYTVNLEAVREHGTYGMIQQDVSIADTPFAKEPKGNDEIQSASIVYRRKAEKPADAK
ncbi:MAG TPA: DUF2271 domain-containing protein, partial [Isosphaeraceae bacterium]|nr:DUF2271 domain-containing protein [Isosphaeraceae bacterium]